MNNNTVIGIFSALFIFIGSWVLSGVNFCGGTTVTPPDFSFTDGAFKTKKVESFSFQKSGIFLTVPATTNGEFKKIAAHFKSNDDRVLSLVGNYYSNEEYKGETNLGQERAEAIKAKLIRYGAPAEKISTSGKKIDEKFEGKKLYNAVIFEGKEKEKEEEPQKEEKKFSIFDPFIINLKTEKSRPQMTAELESYLNLALDYVKKNPGKVLMITGYTKDQNNSKSALKKAKDRAFAVRGLLRKTIDRKYLDYQGKSAEGLELFTSNEDGKMNNYPVAIIIQ